MAADTRAVKRNGVTIVHTDDDQQKIDVISTHTIVGCAGNAHLASHVISELKSHEISQQGIRDFRKNITAIVGPMVGDYLARFHVPYEQCRAVLVFAGLDKSKKKKISFKKLWQKMGEFQEAQKRKIEGRFDGKKLNNFTQEDLRDFMALAKESQTGMRNTIFRGLKVGQKVSDPLEVDAPDSLVFSVRIDCAAKNKFTYTDFEWGDTAIYGSVPSSDQNKLIETLFGEVEFGMTRSNLVERDALRFIARIGESFSATIGGCITMYMISEGSIITLPAEVEITDRTTGERKVVFSTKLISGQLHRKLQDGRLIKLKALTDVAKKTGYYLSA